MPLKAVTGVKRSCARVRANSCATRGNSTHSLLMLAVDRALDGLSQNVSRARFLEETITQAARLIPDIGLPNSAQDDADDVRVCLHCMSKYPDAAAPRHGQIAYENVNVGGSIQPRTCLFGIDGQVRLPLASATMETAANAKQYRWFVIHDKDSFHRPPPSISGVLLEPCWLLCSSLDSPSGTVDGIRTKNVVPRPGSVSNVILPPCRSTTTE